MLNLQLNFDIDKDNKSKEDFINSMTEKVKENEEVGFAGHKYKEDVNKMLSRFMFDVDQDLSDVDFEKLPDSKKIETIIREAVLVCEKLATLDKDTHVQVFPTFSNFVKESMNGSSGFVPYKNIMNLFVASNFDENHLKETVAHEYAHTISYNYGEPKTLIDSIVFEGLAELFSEKITGIRSKHSQSMEKEEALGLFKKLHLDKEGWDEVRELFTRGKKYPLWAGYAISYCVLEDYLEKSNQKIEDILIIDPKEISNAIRG